MAAFFEAIAMSERDMRLDIAQFVCEGDRVVAYGHYAATVQATGKTASAAIAHFFTLRGGAITDVIIIGDTAAMAGARAAGAHA